MGGNTAGWAGLGVADVLIVWLVFSETGSTLAVAAVGVAQTVPPIVLGYLAGALADRYSRRRLLVVTAVAQAAVLGLVPVTLGLVGFRLWILLLVALGLESATLVFGLSATAIVPDLVPPERVEGANALTQAFSSVAWAVGAALASGLLVLVGTSPSFAVNFGVFAAGAVLVALIAVRVADAPAPGATAAKRSFGEEFVEGVEYLRGHPWLLRFTVVAVASGFFVTMFSPYLVVFTVQGLARSANDFGFLAGSYSAGFFVGSLLTARLRVLPRFGRVLGLALLGSGALLGLVVLAPGFGFALVAFGLMGTMMGVVITGSITLIQVVVPSEILGRYLGLQETVVWLVAPVGVLTGGLLIATFGARAGFAVAAVGLLVVGAATLALRSLRSIGAGSATPARLGPTVDGPPLPLAEPNDRRLEASPEPAGLFDEVRS